MQQRQLCLQIRSFSTRMIQGQTPSAPGRGLCNACQECMYWGWIAGWLGGWVGGWVDGCMDGCMDGWMDGWMHVWMHGWMDARMHACTDAWMDACMHACMHACMDGWMDGWMDGPVYAIGIPSEIVHGAAPRGIPWPSKRVSMGRAPSSGQSENLLSCALNPEIQSAETENCSRIAWALSASVSEACPIHIAVSTPSCCSRWRSGGRQGRGTAARREVVQVASHLIRGCRCREWCTRSNLLAKLRCDQI